MNIEQCHIFYLDLFDTEDEMKQVRWNNSTKSSL